MLCTPLLKQFKKNPCDYKGHTHTHVSPRGGSSYLVASLRLVVRPVRSRQEGGKGEKRRKKEERKGKEGVPSYGTSVKGHTKRKREGFPAMTKASRDTQKKKEEGRGREEKDRKQVFPATRKRPRTHQGEVYLSVTFRNTPKKEERRRGGVGRKGTKVATGSNEPQKYFGRSDHVEALSQLRPLRSRKGMSQLGIQ